MTERQFFKRAAGIAAALTVTAVLADRVTSHAQVPVAPFGEPWRTVLGSAVVRLAIIVGAHVVRWVYLIFSGRSPNLG